MAKLKFEVTKIHCLQTQMIEFWRNEIYIAVIPVLGKINHDALDDIRKKRDGSITKEILEGCKILKGHISDVQKKVEKNAVYKPVMDEIIIDTEDYTNGSFIMLLFEQDFGLERQKLVELFKTTDWSIDIVRDADFKEIWDKMISSAQDILKNTGNWLGLVFSILKACFVILPTFIMELGKDDFIDQRVADFTIDDESLVLPREYDFVSEKNGKFKVGIQVTRQ